MALVASNVRVAVTGAIYVGPLTAADPTDATTTATGFTNLGYVSEDGVTETRDRSSEQIRAWQHGATVREVITEGTLTLMCVLLETNKATIEAYYGGTVAADGSIVINTTATGGRKKFIVDVIDGTEFIRTFVKSGEIIEVGDQVYANGEAIGYEVTITAYDTDYSGTNGSAKKWYSSLKTTV